MTENSVHEEYVSHSWAYGWELSQQAISLLKQLKAQIEHPERKTHPEREARAESEARAEGADSLPALIDSLRHRLQHRREANHINESPQGKSPETEPRAPHAPIPEQENTAAIEQLNPFSPNNIKRASIQGMMMTESDPRRNNSPNDLGFADQIDGEMQQKSLIYRKKLMQSKFSRRRYIRDCNGTNLLGVIVLAVIFVAFNVSTILANSVFLIPQTLVNQETGKMSQTLANSINIDRPKLETLIKQRQQIDQQIATSLGNFPSVTQIRDNFANFIEQLAADPNTSIISQSITETPSNVANGAQNGTLANISTISVALELNTVFLAWLKARNDLVKEVGGINITDEAIAAPPGSNRITVSIVMTKHGKN